jgi:pilus assembly protein CpaB
MARRTVLLVLAVVIGLFGAGAVGLYVSKADSRAQAGQQQETVLVAKKLIKSGTAVDVAEKQGLFKPTTMATKDVPPDALSDATSIAKLQAVSDIYPGFPLVPAMFSQTNAATGELTIPDDKMAMSVQLTDPERVAGFVVPGSRVAIFVTFNVNAGGTKDGQTGDVTQLLLQSVPVLAVGQESLRTETNGSGDSNASNSKDAVPVTVLTVAVSQDEAGKLAHGAQVGKLYFALLSPQSATHPANAPVSADSILKAK